MKHVWVLRVRVGRLTVLGCALFACGDDGNRSADAGPEDPDGSVIGAVCGGLGHPPCGAGLYCDYPDVSCGAADQTGTCQPSPQDCSSLSAPVCGCDGEAYRNACTAAAAGTDQAAPGTCAPPAGSFACGVEFCREGTEFCLRLIPGIPEGMASYSCSPLPAACSGVPSCACVTSGPCSDCQDDGAGNLTVTCFAP